MTIGQERKTGGLEIDFSEDIRSMIHTVRGVQIMMDRDLAYLYNVDLKRLNEQVKRNKKRFPKDFMFQLSKEEYESSRSQNATIDIKNSLGSQIATIENGRGKHSKYLPYVFTEQGVTMLSSVLRSEEAIDMSVKIIRAFVAMRKFISSNAQIFYRIDLLERKQMETDRRLDTILSAIESKGIQPEQGIFFDGQVFDAYRFISDLYRSAQSSITIIDNYVDDTVLSHLTKRNEGVKVGILTRSISNTLKQDIKKFNEQFPLVEAIQFNSSHDRFIIIDNSEVYHVGASLKDLGKKWFAFLKMNLGALDLLSKLDEIGI